MRDHGRRGSIGAMMAAGQPLPPPSQPAQPNKLFGPRSFTQATTRFAKRFGKDDDQGAVTEDERRKRQETAAEIADEYYDFATQAYMANWSSHFNYAPFYPGASLLTAQTFYVTRLAYFMNLRPGVLVLDVGCGIGEPAREIARLTGCTIVGISINQRQIDLAITKTAVQGLSDRCTFIRGDFLDLPFPDSNFDAAFSFEALCYAPSLAHIYAEIARVLKPNGRIGLSEWLMTPKYEAKNKEHVAIRNRIERGCGISNLHTYSQAHTALEAAGISIEHDEDFTNTHFNYTSSTQPNRPAPGTSSVQIPSPPSTHPLYDPATHAGETYTAPPPSIRPHGLPKHLIPHDDPSQGYRPWYFLLTGTKEAQKMASCKEDKWLAWKMSRRARRWGTLWFGLLEKVGVYPKGVKEAMKTMEYCVDSVREGGEQGIFTPGWWFVGTKTGRSPKEGNGGIVRREGSASRSNTEVALDNVAAVGAVRKPGEEKIEDSDEKARRAKEEGLPHPPNTNEGFIGERR